MRVTYLSTGLCGLLTAVVAQNTEIGYDCHPQCIASTVPANETEALSFGQHYAVLNLDLINALVDGVANTTAGEAFVNNTVRWIDAVHAQDPPPLSIFTRIFFTNARQPELTPQTPFAKAGSSLGDASDPKTMLFPRIQPDFAAGDIVLQKTRYYAGTGNGLEEILSTQKIDTVILSGIRTSGVIVSTAVRLFDLNYNVYVIANNTIETAPDDVGINTAILEGIIPKLPANVITIEQALAALKNSGPAIY